MEKIKYPYFFNKDRIIQLIKEVNLENNYKLIDILEFRNVLSFFNDNNHFLDFSTQKVKDTKSKMYQIIISFFNDESPNDILDDFKYMFDPDNEEYNILQYRNDYLECFKEYNLAEKVKEEKIELVAQEINLSISLFLNTDYFDKNYPQAMKNIFLKNTSNFELLLNNYTKDFIGNKEKYHIPKKITKDEMYKFCLDYVDSEDCNCNYLKLIEQGIKGIKELIIDGKLKLHAKKKSEEIEKKIFTKDDSSFIKTVNSYKIAIYTQKEDYDKETANFKALIETDWLKKNKNPETLLTYFMYLENFFTPNWILNMCSYPSFEAPIFEKIFSVKSQNHYETSHYFALKNEIMLLMFRIMEDFLRKELNIRIEDLINYFFTKYSEENFRINWLSIEFAKKDENVKIQTINLFTVEEFIRKQWNLLVKEQEIDKDLLKFENTPRIKDLHSLLDKKYVYKNSENKDVPRILNLLFSSQSNIRYIDDNLKAENFVQLIKDKKVNKNNLHNYQHKEIDFLIDKQVISVDKDNFLYLTKKQERRILIFINIYKFGVIHYHYTLCSKKSMSLETQQNEVDEMITEGILISENSLLSKPETDFFNYVLNDSEFDNALALRNKYSHGSVVDNNFEDYLYILIILMVYVIKINEELTLNESIQRNRIENIKDKKTTKETEK